MKRLIRQLFTMRDIIILFDGNIHMINSHKKATCRLVNIESDLLLMPNYREQLRMTIGAGACGRLMGRGRREIFPRVKTGQRTGVRHLLTKINIYVYNYI